MREFSYITVGKILDQLKSQGLKISRLTYYKMEEEGVFMSKKSSGRWRVYTPQEAQAVITAIRMDRGMI
jgi:hypothetical protein